MNCKKRSPLTPEQDRLFTAPCKRSPFESQTSRTQKHLEIASKPCVTLLLSLLSNRSFAQTKTKDFAQGFEDACLAIQVLEDHEERLGRFKLGKTKLHYRRMMALEGVLDTALRTVKNPKIGPVLKTEMVGQIDILMVKFGESCEEVLKSGEESPSGKKAVKSRQSLEERRCQLGKDLETKPSEEKGTVQKEGLEKANAEEPKPIIEKETSPVTKQSDTNITKPMTPKKTESPSNTKPILPPAPGKASPPKSPVSKAFKAQTSSQIVNIARKAMLQLLDSPSLARSSSEFERQLDSFKGDPNMIRKYMSRYQSHNLLTLYAKKKIEVQTILKLVKSFEHGITVENLEESERKRDLETAKMVLQAVFKMKGVSLGFMMMLVSEKKILGKVLRAVDAAVGFEGCAKWVKKYRLE